MNTKNKNKQRANKNQVVGKEKEAEREEAAQESKVPTARGRPGDARASAVDTVGTAPLCKRRGAALFHYSSPLHNFLLSHPTSYQHQTIPILHQRTPSSTSFTIPNSLAVDTTTSVDNCEWTLHPPSPPTFPSPYPHLHTGHPPSLTNLPPPLNVPKFTIPFPSSYSLPLPIHLLIPPHRPPPTHPSLPPFSPQNTPPHPPPPPSTYPSTPSTLKIPIPSPPPPTHSLHTPPVHPPFHTLPTHSPYTPPAQPLSLPSTCPFPSQFPPSPLTTHTLPPPPTYPSSRLAPPLHLHPLPAFPPSTYPTPTHPPPTYPSTGLNSTYYSARSELGHRHTKAQPLYSNSSRKHCPPSPPPHWFIRGGPTPSSKGQQNEK
ncbi:hypothetical protein C7M84_025281 [Penaeus vannamei]|uniref:Uncharacterized protein n=1 Tax=Penaeus vannamei TaxID=6689 RepID=A0A3R7QX86_PENVA|nr:hypothetical protein C7M84_025281 [Penaeus vannamei]